MVKKSNFIQKLLNDINNRKKINTDSLKFIKRYNLIKVDDNKVSIESSFLGSNYFIKNNSIIHLYSFFTKDSIEKRFHKIIDYYFKCTITFYNIDKSDVMNFSDMNIFNNDELISYNNDNVNLFINNLLNAGFYLYKCNK